MYSFNITYNSKKKKRKRNKYFSKEFHPREYCDTVKRKFHVLFILALKNIHNILLLEKRLQNNV